MPSIFRFGALASLGLLGSASYGIIITPTNNAEEMWAGAIGSLPSGVEIDSVSFSGADGAVALYKDLAFAPFASLTKGLLMTTGDALLAAGPNDQDSAGIDNLGPNQTFIDYEPGQDIDLLNVATLTVNFTTDHDTRLSFDFTYGSEEYWYYTNSPFNDSFFAFLDNKQQTLARDKNGKAITINNQYLLMDNRPDWFDPTNGYGLPDKGGTGTAEGISELQYDGFTPILRTSFSAKEGSHSLRFVIGDAGDGVLDSGVFLSNVLSHGSGSDGDEGEDTDPVPEPATLVGLGTLIAALLARRRRV